MNDVQLFQSDICRNSMGKETVCKVLFWLPFFYACALPSCHSRKNKLNAEHFYSMAEIGGLSDQTGHTHLSSHHAVISWINVHSFPAINFLLCTSSVWVHHVQIYVPKNGASDQKSKQNIHNCVITSQTQNIPLLHELQLTGDASQISEASS